MDDCRFRSPRAVDCLSRLSPPPCGRRRDLGNRVRRPLRWHGSQTHRRARCAATARLPSSTRWPSCHRLRSCGNWATTASTVTSGSLGSGGQQSIGIRLFDRRSSASSATDRDCNLAIRSRSKRDEEPASHRLTKLQDKATSLDGIRMIDLQHANRRSSDFRPRRRLNLLGKPVWLAGGGVDQNRDPPQSPSLRRRDMPEARIRRNCGPAWNVADRRGLDTMCWCRR